MTMTNVCCESTTHLLCRLPLRQLAEALLPRPHAGVNDLQEQLPRAWVEDEDGTIDGLGGQVALKRLVDSHPARHDVTQNSQTSKCKQDGKGWQGDASPSIGTTLEAQQSTTETATTSKCEPERGGRGPQELAGCGTTSATHTYTHVSSATSTPHKNTFSLCTHTAHLNCTHMPVLLPCAAD